MLDKCPATMSSTSPMPQDLSRNHDDNPYGGDGFDWEGYVKSRVSQSQKHLRPGHLNPSLRSQPTLPDEAYETLYDYHRAGGNEWNMALDLACGPGTGPTSTLADHFKSVVGCDRNTEQLAIARKRFAAKPSVTFRQSVVENLSWVEPGSVDVITCSTSLHCALRLASCVLRLALKLLDLLNAPLCSGVDIPTVIGEVSRCLKPGGTFSALTCAATGSSGNAEIDKLMRDVEGKSVREVLPPPETSSVTRTFLETLHSHYDNVAIPPDLFTHETRVHWNKESSIFFVQSNPAAVDRRNPESEGYNEVFPELKGYARS